MAMAGIVGAVEIAYLLPPMCINTKTGTASNFCVHLIY